MKKLLSLLVFTISIFFSQITLSKDREETPIRLSTKNVNFVHPPSLVNNDKHLAFLSDITWLGTVSTAWNNAANWSQGVVPDISHRVIIPNTTLKPIISGGVQAIASSIKINNGASLTIQATAQINTYSLENEGTVQNNGKIQISTLGMVNTIGIRNKNAFNNATGAEITLENLYINAILNETGTFSNSGKIIISEININAEDGYGIRNLATFNNNASGEIITERTKVAIRNDLTFNNLGKIMIGSVSAYEITTLGIDNWATFNNNAGAQVKIDKLYSGGVGIRNRAGTFTNNSAIDIGTTRIAGGIGDTGIENWAIFNNNASGNIQLNRSTSVDLFNLSSTFTNAGTLTSGLSGSAGGAGITNHATINNNSCGKMLVQSGFHSGNTTSTVTNTSGLIQINGGANYQGSFINNGVLKYVGTISNLSNTGNASVIIKDNPTPIFTYGSTYNGTINGIYTDALATIPAGSFTAPNNFTPAGLPIGSQTLYAKISLSGGACSFIVPFVYVYSIPQINLKGNSVDISKGDTSPAASDNTDFGSQSIFSGSITKTFTIENLGNANLTLGGSPRVSISGTNAADFTVSVQPASPVAASGSTNFQITFDPSTLGVKNATVSITNNDASKNPYTFAISGSGSNTCTAVSTSTELMTWTGAAGNLWNDVCNWSPIGVPTATNEVKIPGTTSNQPIINTNIAALAKTVEVEIGATLTIASSGSLTINSSKTHLGLSTCLIINGTLQNNGQLIIGNTANAGQQGIWNNGLVNNNNGAELRINNVSTTGLSNTSGGTFNNAGKIGIGAIAMGTFGLDNRGNFNNNAGGEIKLDRASYIDLNAREGTFTNASAIIIGSVASIGNHGLNNNATFINNVGAEIKIDKTSEVALHNENGIFHNYAKITIGTTSGGNTGISNRTLFSNYEGAEIAIDKTTSYALNNPNSNFSNSGILTIGTGASAGINNDAILSNLSCAKIIIRSGGLYNRAGAHTINSGGLLEVLNTLSNAGEFTNNGVLKYATLVGSVNNTSTASLIVNNTPAPIFTYGNIYNGAVNGIYTNAAATTSAGTFIAPNTFIPNSNPTSIQTLYAKITPAGGSCFYIVPFTFNPPDINLKGNNVTIVNGDTTPSTTDHTDFGSDMLGQSLVQRTFLIENTGIGALSLNGSPSVSILGANADDFTVSVFPNPSIAASGSSTFQVRFSPLAAGERNAYISIANNDTDENPYTFYIKGTGVIGTKEINLKGNNVSIVSGDTTPSTTDHTDFGPQNITSGSMTRTFTVENLGNSNLNLSGSPRVIVTGANAADFVVNVQPVSPIAASSSTTFQITFDPSTAGVKNATISITNDDANENPYTFAIRGTGLTGCPQVATATSPMTWTGTVSTAWNDACNWSPNGIPNVNNSVTIPAAPGNQPIVVGTLAALAKSVHIQTGATLTIAASASLTINSSVAFGNTTAFYNEGTVHNNGQLILGSTASVGEFALNNLGTFNNNTGAEIKIDNFSFIGLYNQSFGKFDNAGKITIGANASSGSYGIRNEGTFNNNTGGDLRIDRVSSAAIHIGIGTFNNNAKISIASITNVGDYGIRNQAAFNNNAGGEIQIDRTNAAAIFNENGFMKNYATIAIGKNASLGAVGILNTLNFDNYQGGNISIDKAATFALRNSSGFFSNYADVTIGSIAGSSGGVENWGRLFNHSCAKFIMKSGDLTNAFNVFNWSGYMYVQGQINNFQAFVNDGILKYSAFAGPINNFNNSSIIVNNTPAPIFSYGGIYDGTVDGIYKDSAATISAGTFIAPNNFTPTGLTPGVHTLYARITPNNEACSFVVPFTFSMAEINLKGNNVSIVSGDNTPSTADHTDFGIQFTTTGSVTRTFTVENTGGNLLFLDGSPKVSISGTDASNFTVSVQPISPVAAMGNTTFQVTFDPTTVGTKNATISIQNSDSDENPYTFAIRGTGSTTCPTVATSTETMTWTGMVNSNWHNVCNWSPFGIPSATNAVIIPPTTIQPTIIAAAVAKSVHVQNGATLGISAAGTLTINNTNQYAIYTASLYNEGTVQNSGQINIGNTAAIGDLGIYNAGSFSNLSGAHIRIDRSNYIALFNYDNATFVNTAQITIGANTSVGSTGILNAQTFNNNSSGIIKIDRANSEGLYNRGTINNSAIITIGADEIDATDAFSNNGTLNNLICGQIIINRGLLSNNSSGSITNTSGLIQVDNALVNNASFVNNGVLIYGSLAGGNTIASATTASVIIRNSIHPIFVYGGTYNGTINGIYTNAAATTLAGTFTAPNTFTPTTMPGGPQTYYVKITPAGSSCPYIVPFVYTPPVPEINIKGNNTDIVSGATSPTGADHTDFGNQILNSGTTVRTFTIENKGSANLTLGGSPRVSISGTHAANFSVTAMPGASVLPGSSTSFQVSFTTSTTGIKNAIVSIANNDSDENPYTFAIRGNGITACTPVSTTTEVMTWTGAVNSDWKNVCNWSPIGLPTATNEVVIPADAINQPTILAATAAVAKNIEIQSGATLSIAATASLAINSSKEIWGYTTAFYNEGTIHNSGQLIIGNTANVGEYGIWNAGIFNNLSTGQIRIDNTISDGSDLYNYTGATFTNSGKITIGTIANNRTYGINNEGVFTNNAQGDIKIDNINTDGTGIYNYDSFSNTGKITIGATGAAGDNGIYNDGTFENKTGSEIKIDRAGFSAIYSASGSTFINAAKLTLGAIAAVGSYGIYSRAEFTNETGGDIRIDKSSFSGINVNAATFNNAAKITFGSIDSVGYYGIFNRAAFNNNAGGDIVVNRSSYSGIYHVTGTFVNKANITIGTTHGVGLHGLLNEASFNNIAGEIKIDRSTDSYIENSADASLENFAKITVGNLSTAVNTGIVNSSVMLNNPCATIIIKSGGLQNNASGSLSNRGYLQVDGNLNNSTIFNNYGILKYNTVTGAITNSNDSSLVINNSPTPIFTYSGTYNGTISGIFTDAAGTIPAGSFTAPNAFTPNGLSAGLQTLYAKVLPKGGMCTILVPFTYVVGAEINLKGNTIDIVSGDTTPSANDHTHFGIQAVSSGAITRTFTIQNLGTNNLILNGTPRVSISGAHAADFTVLIQPVSPIAANSTAVFQIVFDPSAIGTRNATVSIANNDPDENPYTFAIQGTGSVCPQDLALVNPGDNYSTNMGTIQASQTIQASNTLTAPAKVTYQAGKSITLGPGFQANTGAVFTVQIGGCN